MCGRPPHRLANVGLGPLRIAYTISIYNRCTFYANCTCILYELSLPHVSVWMMTVIMMCGECERMCLCTYYCWHTSESNACGAYCALLIAHAHTTAARPLCENMHAQKIDETINTTVRQRRASSLCQTHVVGDDACHIRTTYGGGTGVLCV